MVVISKNKINRYDEGIKQYYISLIKLFSYQPIVYKF